MSSASILPSHPLSAVNTPWRVPPPAGILDHGDIPKIDSQSIQRLHEAITQTFSLARLPVQIIETIPGPWFCQLTVEAAQGAGQGFLGRFHPQKFALQKTISDQTHFYIKQINTPIPRRPRLQILALNPVIPSIPLQPVLISPAYQQATGNLIIPLGVDLAGQPVVADLTTFPHLLIGGITGAGKSVFLNSLLAGLLCHYSPDQLRFLLCDGNTVELSPYGAIPHIVGEVATEPGEIIPLLDWLRAEIHHRREAVAGGGIKIPYLVMVIEHTFIFTQADRRVSSILTEILPLAPQAGVHFIFTDSYPDAKTLPTAVKHLIPARVCFAVASPNASRMALNQPGAELLHGHGDFLFLTAENQSLQRGHACMLSRHEFLRLLHFWKAQAPL